MSELENQSLEPTERESLAPYQWLTPPPSAPDGPAGQWMPPAQAAPDNSLWHRIAAGVVLAAIIAAAAGAGVGFSLARAIDQRTPTAQTSAEPQGSAANQAPPALAPQAPIAPASPGSAPQSPGGVDAASVAARIEPAIVDITTVIGSSQAAGTGQIISASGEVLTNNHVIDGSSGIQVTLVGDGRTYAAHVIADDPSADIAVIQLEGASGLPTVTFASSSSLVVGQSVVALGNALGNGGTPRATSGSITGLDQTITASEGGGKSEQLNGMVQSDATIWPGDSGGPLVNAASQVVGMITAGEAQGFRSTSSSVAYAIPSDTLLTIVNEIRAGQAAPDISYGQVGYIGVSARTMDAQLAAQLGVNVTSGALVETVVSGGAAANAGIGRLSVITRLGSSTISTIDDLGTAVRSHKPGEKVSVTWVDSSGTHTTTLTLGGVNG
ncbi:MAG TPA: trypsin-like peptidase domain-containing protein [Candidatus Dormibacteraeota bacterium]|nr:trypsin-like peptidase domain-containing protein [Candidatus Dormibacteraeota bacterium]